jgi:hypothetical protein
VQLGLDPCAVVLVLIDKTESDVGGHADPAAPPPPAGGDGGGHMLDRYA